MAAYRQQYTFNFFKVSHKTMREKIQGLVRRLIKLLITADCQELNCLFQECRPLRYSAQGFLEASQFPEEEKEALVQVGYVNAVMDVMQMYLKEVNVQNEIQQINTKYRDRLLTILVRRGTMLHGDLAGELGLSPSGLNAVIKKINGTSVQMVHVEEVSKYKLYSVTPTAYNYVINNNPDLKIECERVSGQESKSLERLYRYMIEINKMAEQRKEKESLCKALDQNTKIDFASKNNRKYLKPAAEYKYKYQCMRKLA